MTTGDRSILTFLAMGSGQHPRIGPIRHAHLLGPEGVPAVGEVVTDGDLVVCVKPGPESVALGIQVELDEGAMRSELGEACLDPGGDGLGVSTPGVLTLRTCLLPPRARPYLLSLELARHRITMFYEKLEEWQLVDLAAEHPALTRFEAGRALFMRALATQHGGGPGPGYAGPGPVDGGVGAGVEVGESGGGAGATGAATAAVTEESWGFSLEAARLASRALLLLVDAGERLTIESARRVFVPRATGALYRVARASTPMPPTREGAPVTLPDACGVVLSGRAAVGSAVSPLSFPEPAMEVASGSLDFVSMPMRWVEMEPAEGRYAWKNTDRWIEWAVRKARLQVTAGPLIDFRPACVPEWLYIWENDYETLREYALDHVKSVVTRYRRTISQWTVLTGLHTNENFRFSVEQMLDLTRVVVSRVRQLHPTARIVIEVSQPWGEYYTEQRRGVPPMLYADMLASHAGVMIDAFGLRVQMGQHAPGQSTRDLMSFSDMLDRYARSDRPLAITAIGAPSSRPAAGPELGFREPGYWRRPWGEEPQADWATALLAVAAAKPYVQSVCWHDLYDVPQSSEMPRGGLVGMSGAAKPIVHRVRDLTLALREGRLPVHFEPDFLLGSRG